MKIVVEQSEMWDSAISVTYQEPFPPFVPCKKCKNKAILYMLIDDEEKALVSQRPVDAHIWPHDSSVTAIYFCCGCGSMRARWNQA